MDGLRRAFSDPALDQVAPHITLVAPVNVRAEDLADGLRVLRDAAAEVGPLDLVIGPVTTFEGDEHVAYLEVRRRRPIDGRARPPADTLRSRRRSSGGWITTSCPT